MTVPQITVVMGVYNDAETVSAAIESIRAQTLADWELVIVNDGSTDGTAALLDEHAAHDRRIRVIHQGNFGLTRALIVGCSAARGEYIARQDADDISLPQRLEKQADHLRRHPQVGLVACWAQYLAPAGEELELVTRTVDAPTATRLLVAEQQGLPAHGTAMFRRSLYESVGGYRPEFYFSQDNDLWLRLTERAQLAYVGECLYRCRRCATGISGAQHGTQWEFGRLAFASRNVRDRGESDADLVQRAAALTAEVREKRQQGRTETPPGSDMLYIIGTQLARNGDARAVNYLWPVLRRRPWDWRAWVRILQSGLNSRRRRAPLPATAVPRPTVDDLHESAL